MGNLVGLDAAKKQQVEDIAKEFLATFATEYVLAYGTEFAKMKLKEIDQETYGKEERKKELMYRKKQELTDPHKMGYLTKQGAIRKNWKKRYFVVNPDYSVSYYENEEAYEKGVKPKGVIYLAGYSVEENADSAAVEKLKALGKTLGLKEEDLPLPDKYPEHTMELMHERRRPYYIQPEDEETKKEWLEMFNTCCKRTAGLRNKDPVAQAAFKTAYYRSCQKSCWYTRHGDCGGTEEQILSETIVDIINYRVLSSTYSSLTGNYIIRKKVREQVMKALDSIVLAMVIPGYKGVVDSTQTMKAPLEKIIDEKKGEVVSVQKKITDQLSDKMAAIVTKAVEAMEDIKKMFGDLKEVAVKASGEMRKHCINGLTDTLIKDTKESKDVKETLKKHYKIFDNVALSLTYWSKWYYVYNAEQENIAVIRKYKDTFDQNPGYTSVYLSHDILCEVADAAFYTFETVFDDRIKRIELDLKENAKAAEIMESIRDDILPKYDHDSEMKPDDIAFQITTLVVVEYVTTKIDPLTKDIRKSVGQLIPEPLSKIVSIEDRYELYIEECCKGLIRKALGIAKPKQSTKEEKKMEPMGEPMKPVENGEMKGEETKEEMKGEEMKEEMKEKIKEEETKGEETKGEEQNTCGLDEKEAVKEQEKSDINGEMEEVKINDETDEKSEVKSEAEEGKETTETSENTPM